jgi:hypothetical protein
MSTIRPHSFGHQRWAWLFGLAVCLVLAQGAAAWHRVSHLASEAAPAEGGKAAAHDAQCELCLIACAVDGAASPPAVPSLVTPTTEPVWLAVNESAAPSVAPVLAYRSRAPPSTPV